MYIFDMFFSITLLFSYENILNLSVQHIRSMENAAGELIEYMYDENVLF